MKDAIKKKADQLLKQYEEAYSLKDLRKPALGLAALFTNKTKEELSKEYLESALPCLKKELEERLEFFEKKKEYNGNIPNLKREIKKCMEFSTLVQENPIDLPSMTETINWITDINTKYGFSGI